MTFSVLSKFNAPLTSLDHASLGRIRPVVIESPVVIIMSRFLLFN